MESITKVILQVLGLQREQAQILRDIESHRSLCEHLAASMADGKHLQDYHQQSVDLDELARIRNGHQERLDELQDRFKVNQDLILKILEGAMTAA